MGWPPTTSRTAALATIALILLAGNAAADATDAAFGQTITTAAGMSSGLGAVAA